MEGSDSEVVTESEAAILVDPDRPDGFEGVVDATADPARVAAASGAAGAEQRAALRPPLEIDYVFERGSPTLLRGPWRAVEIWTHNRMYVLDPALVCLDVIDRATGCSAPDNPIVGARLLGGQRRGSDGSIKEVSHPLPGEGAAAVFAQSVGKRISLSETSPVTRVIMRLRVVRVGPDGAPPSWEKITGEHGLP